jgi:D-alanyl-D-alanine carboxypeptidase
MWKFGAANCRKQLAVPSLVSALALASLIALPAEARHWRHHHRHGPAQTHFARHRHHEESLRYHHQATSPRALNIALIVVDANSGRTLYARNENEQRFPASITKVMTLYLLFEQLERGTLRLNSELQISSHAAAQKPTKLGLRPGQTISVDEAIKAVVTRSANDIAVAIAEAIGGSEENFARLMTLKAHALGMSSTHFANASGLPNPEQLTTAHDLAILGRAIQERFPRYYPYFATRTFYYHGAAIANHNHLLGRVEGMDGIKTGYTNASGFNLLTSVKRDGHYIVAVVLGGPTARARDKIMADLIEDHIENGATIRTASLSQELPAYPERAQAREQHEVSPPGGLQPKFSLRVTAQPSVQKPNPAIESVQAASFNADAPHERPRPAFVPGAPRPEASINGTARGGSLKQTSLDGSTSYASSKDSGEIATATPSAIRAAANPSQARPVKAAAGAGETSDEGASKVAFARPPAARSGWMIQIGATSSADKASELLARAKSEGPKALTKAQAFTEKVQKGPETFYRARFAGLEEDSAELVCKHLKRSGFSCFATKN